MKAEINASGWLTITANSPTDQYALKQWWLNYQRGDLSSILALNYDSAEASIKTKTISTIQPTIPSAFI